MRPGRSFIKKWVRGALIHHGGNLGEDWLKMSNISRYSNFNNSQNPFFVLCHLPLGIVIAHCFHLHVKAKSLPKFALKRLYSIATPGHILIIFPPSTSLFLAFFSQTLPIRKGLREGKKNISLWQECKNFEKAKKVKVIQPPKKKKRQEPGVENFPPHEVTYAAVFLPRLAAFRLWNWSVSAIFSGWLGSVAICRILEESALRGKTIPLQSDSLVGRQKGNQWAQTSKRVLHFVCQYSRAFAASLGISPTHASPTTHFLAISSVVAHKERWLAVNEKYAFFPSPGTWFNRNYSMASESPAAEFRVLGWHLVDMTGSHSSKWGAVLFLYLINGFKWVD